MSSVLNDLKRTPNLNLTTKDLASESRELHLPDCLDTRVLRIGIRAIAQVFGRSEQRPTSRDVRSAHGGLPSLSSPSGGITLASKTVHDHAQPTYLLPKISSTTTYARASSHRDLLSSIAIRERHPTRIRTS